MVDPRKISEALSGIQQGDARLAEELNRRLAAPAHEVALLREGVATPLDGMTIETIVLRTGRPVLAIKQDAVEVVIEDAESEVWRERLRQAGPLLGKPIRAVGRVEVKGHPNYTWLGTGWLVSEDILVTNRHVAAEFTRRSGTGFEFRLALGQKPMEASVDFLEEIDNTQDRTFKLREVLHVEDEEGPDLAFFRVAGASLPQPIPLSANAASASDFVAAIGYPARDSRIPEQDLMDKLFGNVYDKKRLAPGKVTDVAGGLLRHDCSTLGGNSGSVLVDMESGEAVGIHFAGRFLEANYAVPGHRVAERLRAIEHGTGSRPAVPDRAAPSRPRQASGPGGTVSITIPLHVTVRLGEAVSGSPAAASAGTVTGTPLPPPPVEDGDDDEVELFTEGRAEDYEDRAGYLADFLGHGIEVSLPRIERDHAQILTFPFKGNEAETELRYQNFSVVMHKERRMCFYSAVNIDGNLSRKTKRPGWMLDPRIPKELQIIKECYGNPPKFSRGHMTRREDPAWGDAEAAHRGNADSMHVTNVVPQMQSFNAGIWLGLEDYALENAREDDMKICVITGSVFRSNDPVRYGVKIPVDFWKVIAFIHDETGELSATGYSISQRKFLSEEEFVFGAYETHQRSLKWIEDRAGVSFGQLTGLDRFREEESLQPRPILGPGQIRWR